MSCACRNSPDPEPSIGVDGEKQESKAAKGCECCAKTCLVIVNVLFQVLGFVLLVIGLVLRFGWSLLEDAVLPLLSTSSDTTTDSSVGSSLTDALPDLLWLAAYMFIGLGCFMFLCGVLGCCGACCKIRTLLIIYVVLVGVVFLGKLIFIIILTTSVLNDSLKQPLKDTITNSFGGISDTAPASLTLNLIMIQYKCCGVDSYTEFHSATQWQRDYELENDDGTVEQVYLEVPVACCKVDGSFPSVTFQNENCTKEPDTDNSNMDTSCWTAVVEEINKYKTIIIGTYSAVLCFEAMCMAVAIYLIIKTVKDEKAGKINPWTD